MTDGSEIAVIGAGVIGLTVAVTIAEAGYPVTVYSDARPLTTTSSAAGALWGPYHSEPWPRVRRWSLDSLDAFTTLAADASTGVRLTWGTEASRVPCEPPAFAELLPEFRLCTPEDLPAGFATGWRSRTPLVDMSVYLPYLQARLEHADGHLVRRHLHDLDEATTLADTVVNCTGLGAGELVPDPDVFPIRGQLVIVRNPGLSEWFSEETGPASELMHIYPHGDTVVLGGLAEPGRDDTAPDPRAAQAIIDRCAAIDSRIATAPVLGHRVGLRPTRPAVRLDTQQRGGTRVLHCYGHGGAGVTLSWGCAAEVLQLIA